MLGAHPRLRCWAALLLAAWCLARLADSPCRPPAPQEVYGSATKSNNNSWLRRKLYEAVGVAPLKANTKGKARKGAGSGSGGSRKSAHSSKDGGGAAKAR